MSNTAPVLSEADCQALEPNARGEVEHNGVVRLCLAVPPSAPLGQLPNAIAFPDRLIPRSEWDERIAEKDREKSWLYDLVHAAGIPCDDQGSLGFCHAFGTTDAAENCRLIQGHPFVRLSGVSIGGPVTNWKNRGADPSDDLTQLATVGACPESFLDDKHSLNPRRWKTGWEEQRAKFMATEIWDMRDGSGKGLAFDFAMTVALLGLAGGIGYSWWSHFVSGPYKARKNGRNYEILNRNQWGCGYGEDGFFWLTEGRGTPTWQTVIRQMTAVDA